jgi:YegS/Rv2252/BmrU family lipid kinase
MDLDIQFTTPEINAGQLAKKALEKGFKSIIVSGGDGTISVAAGALIQTKIPMGIIPRGTANALASALGLPDNIEAACKVILNGYSHTIDVGLCNGKPLVLLAGIGLEAETIEDTSREAKNQWGALAYLMSGIKKLQNFQKFKVEIETEDKIIRTIAAAVTIANTVPATSILAQGPASIIDDDGMLDVTIIAIENWTEGLAASSHLLQTGLRSAPAQRDDIGYFRAKYLKINTEPKQKVVLDGEIIGTTPIEIKCIPKCLTILLPEPKVEQRTEKLEGLPELEVEQKLD